MRGVWCIIPVQSANTTNSMVYIASVLSMLHISMKNMASAWNAMVSKQVEIESPTHHNRRPITCNLILKLRRFYQNHLSHCMTKPTKWHVRPAKTDQPGHPPSLSRFFNVRWMGIAKHTRFLHADSEGTDQTGRMPRLIWVFGGRTGHFVGCIMPRLIYK